jgi:hypothetical protein
MKYLQSTAISESNSMTCLTSSHAYMGGFGFLPTSVISKITSKNPIAEVIHKKVKNEVPIAF